MSKEVDKSYVFKTTKVRTKLKGDSSWLLRSSEPQPEREEEKPWIAEVKAGRLNEAGDEASPVSSPVQSSPSPLKTGSERSPTSGFLIRGVFTKMEKTPTTSNGHNGTTQFTKKPSETYKKIAPHTVRNITENQEGQLSPEEQERRTEAASSVLRKSSTRQRSYVLSAAKLYESKDKTPDLLVNSTASFVAQRVEITDDEEANATSPTSTTTTSTTTTSTTSVSPPPEPSTSVNTSSAQIDVTVEVKTEEAKEKEKDPFEDIVPGCTKVATPLPELIPDVVQVACVKSGDSAEEPESPVAETTPPSPPAPVTPPPQTVTAESIVITTEETVEEAPEQTHVDSSQSLVEECNADTTPERCEVDEPLQLVEVEPPKTPEVDAELDPEVELSTETLKPQAEPELNLVQAESDQINLKEEEPGQLVEVEEVDEQKEAETETRTDDEPKQDLVEIESTQISTEKESTNTISNVDLLTDDALDFNDSPELVPLASSSTAPWSQDVLSPVESKEPEPSKPSVSPVDLLSNEDIVVTEVQRTQPEEEKQPVTVHLPSVTETVTITTQTVIVTDEREEESSDPPSSHVITTVTESSSTDPFDPYPIGTTSSNSSSDLLKPLADISINSASDTSVETKAVSAETNMSDNLLDSPSDDIIQLDTEATPSLGTHRSWTLTWESAQTGSTEESTEESQETVQAEEGRTEDQQTVIMFERKSNENDSPWDKWMSPTVYTISTNEENNEEEESDIQQDPDTQIITTVTTISETHSEPEPSMDGTLTEPEADIKKPFVYVKEYVNTSEISLLNARDADSSDYLKSTSTSYSYSSPSYSRGTLSSSCTFCGEQVGDDAKITIEHLNINCHPDCFKCGVCGTPMGDLLHKMFLHGGKVHCDSCYGNALL